LLVDDWLVRPHTVSHLQGVLQIQDRLPQLRPVASEWGRAKERGPHVEYLVYLVPATGSWSPSLPVQTVKRDWL